MGWEWGRLVKTGLVLGDYTGLGGTRFCGWCLYWHRIWFRMVLSKSSTFVGFDPK